MKRVVIKEAEWGAGGLLTKAGKLCCLGFGCLALGHSRNKIRAYVMPITLHEYRFERTASKELYEKAQLHFPEGWLGQNEFKTISRIAAAANDIYHGTGVDKTTKASMLDIMRQCFREVGLVFVLRKAKP